MSYTWYPPCGCLVPLNTEAPWPTLGPSPSSASCTDTGEREPEPNTNNPPPSRGLTQRQDRG